MKEATGAQGRGPEIAAHETATTAAGAPEVTLAEIAAAERGRPLQGRSTVPPRPFPNCKAAMRQAESLRIAIRR
jgi:hypothetical protein